MQEPDKDSRLKYVDMGKTFANHAGAIARQTKISQATCERLASHLSKQKPRTPEEFERVEYLKNFVLETSTLNEMTITLIDYIHGLLSDIATDSEVLIEGAILRDKLHYQSETLELMIQDRDKHVQHIYDKKIEELRQNKANP